MPFTKNCETAYFVYIFNIFKHCLVLGNSVLCMKVIEVFCKVFNNF